jgi:hypothetical protein
MAKKSLGEGFTFHEVAWREPFRVILSCESGFLHRQDKAGGGEE